MQPWAYVVLLGILCLVISWFIKEPAQASVMAKDIEDAMDLVAANLEQENKELLDSMTRLKSEYERQADKLDARVAELDKRVGELSAELREQQRQQSQNQVQNLSYNQGSSQNQNLMTVRDMNPAVKPDIAAEAEPEQDEPVAATISQRYPELFQLHNQGKSVESIARKLDMNKGEVALILQLSRREDEEHV
ncbi:DUF6115 domain-containing protein [Gorillibacterium massiliense]|uniref:DUF6115 domain-containing protein n=1 Tax=Gorillibacterium massiliense TaxID=1280390 RepID=UPI00059264EE|nr:hypothetical protein [Gorillibacterium massiliense]